MQCPTCRSNTKVIDTRLHPSTGELRRRRECLKCGDRFTSYEFTKIKTDAKPVKTAANNVMELLGVISDKLDKLYTLIPISKSDNNNQNLCVICNQPVNSKQKRKVTCSPYCYNINWQRKRRGQNV